MSAMHLNEELIPAIEQASAAAREALSQGRAPEAVALVRDLLAIDPDDHNVCTVVSATLIDATGVLPNLDAANQGMKIIERMLAEWEDASEGTLMQLRFNLANGYSARYSYFRRQGEAARAEESLQQEKHILQSLLLRRQHLSAEIKPAVLTNYANCLDHLSRAYEAIDQYFDCLRIEPNHSLARGNCARAISRVTYFSAEHRLSNLHTAWELSAQAVARPQGTLQWAGPQAVSHLEERHRRLELELEETLVGGVVALEEFIEHRFRDHPKKPCPAWLEQPRADRLLLTSNQLPMASAHETLDDAFFDTLAFGFSEEEEAESIDLIHLFNAIKEEFVTARHLYYLAENQDETLIARNDVTLYGDPEGDAEFGLISGLLKASLRGAVDLLDKVAVFLSAYLALHKQGARVNFNNFWFEKANPRLGAVHPRLEEVIETNYPLQGLRDIQRDFFRQEYPGPVKNARNATVHKWLRLSWLPIEKGSGDGASWNLGDFTAVTLFMLRQSKAAVLLLAAAVNLEERRRKASNNAKKVLVQRPLEVRKPISARATQEIAEELLSGIDASPEDSGPGYSSEEE